jgi:hypothetical protein
MIALTSCIDDEYDLSEGLNTEISVGGDSLSIPIGKTTKIFLGSMLDKQNLEMLKKAEDGTFSMFMSDSMLLNMGSINPVSFSVTPISIAPFSVDFSEIVWPEFKLDPISAESNLTLPSFHIDENTIDPINASYTQKYVITSSSNSPQYIKKSSKSASSSVTIGPLRKNFYQIIEQNFEFSFPNGLKRIDKLLLKNSKVTLTFDKTSTNLIGFLSQKDTIKYFKLDFPSEVKITSPQGLNSRIEGSSFIIENAALTKGVDVFTCSFIVESMNLSNIPQNGSLAYNKPLYYELDYSFIGEAENLEDIIGS